MTDPQQVDVSGLLKRDLAAFADPGTAVDIGEGAEGWVSAAWQQDGRPRGASFRLTSDATLRDVVVRPQGVDGEVGYASFLAGERMGDLKALARNTLSVVPDVTAYVAPNAVADGDGQTDTADILVGDLARDSRDETVVVFVTAEAGVGKTSLLTQLVRHQAEAYLRGEDDRLWLYVNAQGSRLARLDQALAATLDDLRAHFPYHAAAALVRSGALVLVIDGFDELIGTQGSYDEAFSSLASFIEELRGAGTLVAAARSAYYEQEFASRADTTIGFQTDRWALRPVALSEWTRAERDQFLERLTTVQGRGDGDLKHRIDTLFEDTAISDLGGKPLFVTRLASLMLDGAEIEPGEDLVHRLVTTYIRREAGTKLVSPRGDALLTEIQLADFLREIADEMWRQEARELSRTSLRELVDIVAELHGLDIDARLTLVERAPYIAMMRTGSAPGSVAFEHELYLAFFLSQPIVEAIQTGERLTIARALRKGRLPEQAGAMAGQALRGSPLQDLVDVLAEASSALSSGVSQVRENAGLVLAGVLANTGHEGARIHGIDFIDCDLRRMRLQHSTVEGCELRGVDLRGAVFIDCEATNVSIDSVIADRSTRLGLNGIPVLAFSGMTWVDDEGARRTLYSPHDLRDVLSQMSLPAAQTVPETRGIDPSAVELVQLFARIYETTNLATPDDSNLMERIVQHRLWPTVHDVLNQSGVIGEEKRSAHGNKTFMRILVRPRDLLSGQARDAIVDPRVEEFWDALERRAPASV